jgi:hypothetical protein
MITGARELGFYARWGGWLSIAGFLSLAWLLLRLPSRGTAAFRTRE